MLFWGILFLGIIVFTLVALARYLQGTNRPNMQQSCNHGENRNGRALEILNERFARGEINEDEYTAKKNTILKN